MTKHLLCGGVLLFTFAIAARADINPEPFTDPGYVAGNALSAFAWEGYPGPDQNGDPQPPQDTTGVLDLEDVDGSHGLVVKLSANGPTTGSAFPAIIAQQGPFWGGPSRLLDDSVSAHQLWFSVDVEKGVPGETSPGGPLTPLGTNIWRVQFSRNNGVPGQGGGELVLLQGGMGDFQVRSTGLATLDPPLPPNTATTPKFSFTDGWNNITIRSDLAIVDPMNPQAPNTFVYLNKVQVAAFHIVLDSGPLGREDGDDSVGRVLLYRLSRGGPMDGFVGTMRFDNFNTANESLFPGDVNSDAVVDIFDINFVSAHWGEMTNQTTEPLDPVGPGDANRDGIVDIFDINLISSNWAPGPGAATPIPEPATYVLLSVGLAGLALIYRRRVKH